MSGLFLGKGLGRSHLGCDCCEIAPSCLAPSLEAETPPSVPSLEQKEGRGKTKHHPKCVVGCFGCFRLLLQPSAWHFCGETLLAFIVRDAIVALNILCLFLNKLRSRVLLRCLPGGCSAPAVLMNKRRLRNGHLFVPGNEAGLYPKSLPGFFVVF